MSTIGGRKPRDQGNRAERLVAKYLDGERIIGSGAYKFSNKNLVGDVDVRINGHEYLKLEVKTTGAERKNGMFYVMRHDVLRQMHEEAERFHQKGALWLHFKNSSPANDFVFFPEFHLIELGYDAGVHPYQIISVNSIQGGKSSTLYQNDLDRLLMVPVDIDKFAVVSYTSEGDVATRYYSMIRGRDVWELLQRVKERSHV